MSGGEGGGREGWLGGGSQTGRGSGGMLFSVIYLLRLLVIIL